MTKDSENREAGTRVRWLFGLRAAGGVAAVLGLVTLAGWVTGRLLWASFGADLIPMAPSTAALLLLFGVAVILRARTPLSARFFGLCMAVGWLVALVALVLLGLACLNIHWAGEHPGLVAAEMVQGSVTGHMSEVSACLFLLISVAFLASLSRDGKIRRWRTVLALGAVGVLLTTCLIFLLADIFGVPLLYGGAFIPPAHSTVFAFSVLGLAHMVMAWRAGGLGGEVSAEGSRTAFRFILIFVILAAGIITVGYIHYRHYENHFRGEVEHQLSAIADLKVGELVQWRKERLADVAIFFKNPSFTALVRRFLEQPADADAQRQLQEWLGKYPASRDYNRVRLLDTQDVVRLSLPADPEPTCPETWWAATEALRLGQTIIEDFNRHSNAQAIYLSVMVPIIDEADASRPLGVLNLRIDPEKYLYPFIQRWPVLSPTAETLLLRRDGNDVLFLSNANFQTNAALNLRIPLDKAGFPVVRAVLGQQGVVEGLDYCGCQTLAVLRVVPDSAWFMVARIETAEVYAPLHEQLWQMVALIGVLIFGAGAGVGLIWRHQRTRFYKEIAVNAEALRESEKRFMDVLHAANDAILLIDGDKFVDCNDATVQMLGYANCAAFLMSHPSQLSPPMQPDGRKSFEKANEMIQTAIEKGFHRFEWIHRRSNGEDFPVEVSLTAISYRGKTILHCLWRDITARKQAEEKIRYLLADLERSNEELEQFANIASHDLQEPLRMVLSYMQLLAMRYEGQLDEKAQKYIDYAVDGAIRMQRIINDLLNYSRVGTRGKPLATTDVHSVMGEVISNLDVMIEESKAIITNEDLPAVRVDASQLVQVFQNLLANAIKFRGEDNPRIHVSGRDDGHEWVFSVRDNGIGIEPQHADRVFAIFQRLHTREEYPGTGIGLAVCKRIVERHDGRIWFESEPGKGTTFFFTIPK